MKENDVQGQISPQILHTSEKSSAPPSSSCYLTCQLGTQYCETVNQCSIYVCVCLHMGAWTCTYTCMWVGVPTGAREEHQVSLSITLHHSALRQGLSLNLEMTATKALCPCGLHVYTVLGLQVQDKDFTQVLGFRFRSSNLPSKPPYPLSPLSATLNWNS